MNIAWIDLETTGSDEHAGSLLEVAAIVTDEHLRELDRAEWLVDPDIEHVATMAEVVRAMHTESGLLDEIDRHKAAHLAGRYPDAVVDPPDYVDRRLRDLLDLYAIRGRLILAGSGVGHFDSRWIRAHLPRSAKRLTYYPWDVGVVRRFLGSVDPALVLEQHPAGAKPHRAMADAELHLAEWRAYRDAMREAAPDFAVGLARARAIAGNTAPTR
jgi:oligoribonuclease